MQIDPESPDARDTERGIRDAAVTIHAAGVRRERGNDRLLDIQAVQWTVGERDDHSTVNNIEAVLPPTQDAQVPF